MLIKDILLFLTEYNNSKTNTTLAGAGGNKASGKNWDNIVTGKTKPYKGNEYETKYAKVFPALAELVKKVKSNAIKGDIIVTGSALSELDNLLKGYRPKMTPEGDYSLPFGDNVRLKQRSNAYFIGYNDPRALQSTTSNIDNPSSTDIAITK